MVILVRDIMGTRILNCEAKASVLHNKWQIALVAFTEERYAADGKMPT